MHSELMCIVLKVIYVEYTLKSLFSVTLDAVDLNTKLKKVLSQGICNRWLRWGHSN